MGVVKRNVEVVNVDHLFLYLVHKYTTRGKHCSDHPSFPLEIDSDSPSFSHATLEHFLPIPAPALLVLQEFITPEFWCATREVTLLYGSGEEGPLERWEGGLERVDNAVLAFACHSGSTLVACRNDPLHLRGNTRRPPSKWVLLCSG